MNEILIGLIGLIALAAVLVVLVRTVTGDGYGVRPGPRSHHEDERRWVMPHDEIRHFIR
jgi:hypothetical protein